MPEVTEQQTYGLNSGRVTREPGRPILCVSVCVCACITQNVLPEQLWLEILANGSARGLALVVRPLPGWKHQDPAVGGGSPHVTTARESVKRDSLQRTGPGETGIRPQWKRRHRSSPEVLPRGARRGGGLHPAPIVLELRGGIYRVIF